MFYHSFLRYLVPADLTVGQFKYVVRKRVKPGAEILVFVNNTLIPPNGKGCKLSTPYNIRSFFTKLGLTGLSLLY